MAVSRIAFGAAMAAALLIGAGGDEAKAQLSCAELVEASCLGKLGAGAAPLDEDRCNAQWKAYRVCLTAAAGTSENSARSGQACSASQASELWADVKNSRSCIELAAYQEACPGAPQSRIAAARFQRLNCGANGVQQGFAAVPETPATTPAGPVSPHMIRSAQIELQRLNRYNGAIDGIWGEGSSSALKAFQNEKGISPADGVVSETTLVALRAAPTPEGPRGPRPGDTFRDCVDCPEMVVAPSGRFRMGSPESEEGRLETEGPTRNVRIASFAIGRGEVTRGEFRRFVEATGYNPPTKCYSDIDGPWADKEGVTWLTTGYSQTDEHPVVCVGWHDAQAYIEWLNSKVEGEPYRLPSEAEWEYAARAATQTAYPWGSNPNQGCAYVNGADRTAKKTFEHWIIMECDDGYLNTAPTRRFGANGFNIYGMIGNALEFVQDCWNPSYVGAPNDGAPWTAGDCQKTVLRGGSWGSIPARLRAATRLGYPRTFRDNFMGFRVAKTL